MGAEIVDAEGSLAVMIRTAFQVITRRYGASQPVAVAACDILPSVEDLQTLVDQEYRPHEKSMFWWQMIAASAEDLGASAWKPSYNLCPDVGQPPLRLYPGHIVVFRPDAVRVGLASSLLELAYRYRNRELRRRWAPLLLRSLGRLIWEDVRNLSRFQLPVLTAALPFRGLTAYWKYRRGGLTIPELERHVARMLLHRKYYHASGNRPLVVSVSRVTSLAKDIDTKHELAEAAARTTVENGPLRNLARPRFARPQPKKEGILAIW